MSEYVIKMIEMLKKPIHKHVIRNSRVDIRLENAAVVYSDSIYSIPISSLRVKDLKSCNRITKL